MDITQRIARVTEDLRSIQQQMDSATERLGTHKEVVDRLVAGELLNDLKSAVDHMRHFLWAYIEATAHGPEELKSTIQSYRMQRVTEMLRVLRENNVPALAETPEGRGFFEEINSIAHAAVDRHAEKAKSSK